MSLDQILAVLQVGGGDARLLDRCLHALRQAIPSASSRQRSALHRIVLRTWDRHLPLGEAHDLAFDLGHLLADLGDHRGALRMFCISREMHGPDAAVAYNAALCCAHPSAPPMQRAACWQ